MPRCCGGGTCLCAIDPGPHIQILGVGSAADPFIIVGDVALQELDDNTTFNVGVTGSGTTTSPWTVSVNWAATAKLDDIPDVTAPAPTNGQVLGWDSATSKWTPRAPTTTATGAVTHDTSLAGDGAAGTPLQVQEDPAGFLTTRTPGLGLSDTGINSLVRKFATDAARTAASPAPTLNTVSEVDTRPGQIDYWSGSAWRHAGGSIFFESVSANEFYIISGAYDGIKRAGMIVRHLGVTTDTEGKAILLSTTDLAGKAGILTIHTQLIEPSAHIPLIVQVAGGAGQVTGYFYRVSDGTPYVGGFASVMVSALVY